MPTLGDYLGFLLSEITAARLQADLAAVQIAQLYASHPLLKHMPVPRFRLPSIKLDIPIAIAGLGDGIGSQQPTAADWGVTRKNIDGLIQQEANKRRINLTPSVHTELKSSLDNIFSKFQAAGPISVSSLVKMADQTAQMVEGILAKAPVESPILAPTEGASLSDGFSLQHGFTREFAKLASVSSRVEVVATTTQLQTMGPVQNLTRINACFTEQGVEWSQSNLLDSSSATLIPE